MESEPKFCFLVLTFFFAKWDPSRIKSGTGFRSKALQPGFWLSQSLRPSARKRRKTLGDDPIYLAPERHDEISDMVEPFPSPGIELSRLAVA